MKNILFILLACLPFVSCTKDNEVKGNYYVKYEFSVGSQYTLYDTPYWGPSKSYYDYDLLVSIMTDKGLKEYKVRKVHIQNYLVQ